MSRRRRPRPPETPRPTGPGDESGPSLVELERFSQSSLQQWLAAASHLQKLQAALYFGLEAVRKSHGAQLLAALRFATRREFPFEGWSRIVDYRYALEPLSVAGSVKGEGGRFNIGAGLSPGAFTPFPALYLAEDYSTAFREKFGGPAESSGELSTAELALRGPDSFAQVRLRGAIDGVVDLSDAASLKAFVDVIKTFAMPKLVDQLARRLALRRPPFLIRSPTMLQRQLLDPNWRVLPMQYDLPSNSQVFGRIASAAGVHGILYPSARAAGSSCLALFPQNWGSSSSYLEVMDPSPDATRLTRLDGLTEALR